MKSLNHHRLTKNLAIVIGMAGAAGFLSVPATMYFASHQDSIANLFESRANAQTSGTGSVQGIGGTSTSSPSTTSPSFSNPSNASPSNASPSFSNPSTTNPSFGSPSINSPSTTSPSLSSPSVTNPSTASPSLNSPSTTSPSTTSPSNVAPLGNQPGQGQLPLNQSLPPLFPNQGQQLNPGTVPPGTQTGGQSSNGQGTFQSPSSGIQQFPSNTASPGSSGVPGGAAAPVGTPQSSSSSVVEPGYISRPSDRTVVQNPQPGSTVAQSNQSVPAQTGNGQSTSTQPYTGQTTTGEQPVYSTGANGTSSQTVSSQSQTQYGQAVRALW
jgi:hypothetical protein